MADRIPPPIDGLHQIEGTSPTFAQRVFSKLHVIHPAGCWWWTGAPDHLGYGRIGKGRRGRGMLPAHRAVYLLLVGPIPQGKELDHLCRNPPCCNPDHLQPVTRREHVHRSYSISAAHGKRDTCLKGHPKDGWTLTKKSGWIRYCKACARAKSSARYHARRAAT